MKLFLVSVLAWVSVALLLPTAEGNGGRDDPVMAGYDVVAYHFLDAQSDGVPGKPAFQYRHSGYLYYFVTEENMNLFTSNPTQYVPMYGGFCAWGVAWEYEEDGWPWKDNHMGPPCGPRDGWALLTDPESGEKRLYCSIWRSYQDDFNRNQEEGLRLANQRWKDWYGSLEAGPKNNGCYAWNWRQCFANSIYDPMNPLYEGSDPTPTPTMAPTSTQTLFEEDMSSNLTTGWSEAMTVLNGSLSFTYTLEDVASIRPLLVVDLLYELDDEFDSIGSQYLGFGVAEQVMEGALVVCKPQAEAVAIVKSELALVESTCKTYLGSGMGIAELATDPVQPTVRLSERNETHYHVRFTANLFACWSNPVWPARVLFSRGLVSGSGDPEPHKNNLLHRQAVPGVEFLSVIEYAGGVESPTLDPEGPPEPLELDPLPSYLVVGVDGTAGTLGILEGRVTLNYGLFHYAVEKEEVVRINLLNVPFDPLEENQEHSYIGFGFSAETMTGLIVTCSPSVDWDVDKEGNAVIGNLTAACHQWRGSGTNLYPRSLLADAGGWFLESFEGNETHVNYTLAGRTRDVVEDVAGDRLTADTNLRAICALGRTSPDAATPLMHTSRDRTPVVLQKLAAAAGSTTQKSGTGDAAAVEKSNAASIAPFGFVATMATGLIWILLSV